MRKGLDVLPEEYRRKPVLWWVCKSFTLSALVMSGLVLLNVYELFTTEAVRHRENQDTSVDHSSDTVAKQDGIEIE